MNDFDVSRRQRCRSPSGGGAPYDMFGLNPQLLSSLAIHGPLVKRVFVTKLPTSISFVTKVVNQKDAVLLNFNLRIQSKKLWKKCIAMTSEGGSWL
jgi:hypothetical protein